MTAEAGAQKAGIPRGRLARDGQLRVTLQATSKAACGERAVWQGKGAGPSPPLCVGQAVGRTELGAASGCGNSSGRRGSSGSFSRGRVSFNAWRKPPGARGLTVGELPARLLFAAGVALLRLLPLRRSGSLPGLHKRGREARERTAGQVREEARERGRTAPRD